MVNWVNSLNDSKTRLYSKYNFVHPFYTKGYETCSPSNDAADEIIQTPDVYLLSKDDLFAAEGGWSNITLTAGVAAVFALGLLGTNPALFSHLKNGQLHFREWA